MENDCIREALFARREEEYRRLCCRLTPDIAPDTVLGVRMPAIRALARTLEGTKEAQRFLCELPHRYYEENNLHAALIGRIRTYDECIAALDAFLPYVDNWATCDSLSPPALARDPERLLCDIGRCLASPHVYTVRFGLGMLMRHFLDERFQPRFLEMAAGVRREEYYIRMMVAWFFATALAKQYDAALPYLTERRLEKWTHDKTIQKAVESRRISGEQKAYLRSLRLHGTV